MLNLLSAGDIVEGRRESWPIVEEITEGRTNKSYAIFGRELLPTVVYAKTFKDHSSVELMRNWFPVHLEAFAVAIYINGYHAWSMEAQKRGNANRLNEEASMDDGDGESTLSTDESGNFPFTGNSRGAKRFQGWKKPGVDLYNSMVVKLGVQRGEKETGVDLEETWMDDWAEVSTVLMAEEDRNDLPIALNGLDLIPI